MTSLGASCFSCPSSFIFPVVSFSLGDTLGAWGGRRMLLAFSLSILFCRRRLSRTLASAAVLGNNSFFTFCLASPHAVPRPFLLLLFSVDWASKSSQSTKRDGRRCQARPKPSPLLNGASHIIHPHQRAGMRLRREKRKTGRQEDRHQRKQDPWSVRSACWGALWVVPLFDAQGGRGPGLAADRGLA